MARATNKKELINLAKDQYERLWSLVDSLSEEDQEKSFVFDISNEKEAHWKRDKNIRDVLVHLYEWHQLLLNWVNLNMSGVDKQFLLEPYTWKTYGDMNIEFWKKHQETNYEEAKKMVKKSHQDVMLLIDKFDDEQLFVKAYFSWTGTTSLGQYCVSATSSHYDWALKKIKKQMKALI